MEAAIDARTLISVAVVPLGHKRPSPAGVFNVDVFEQTIAVGTRELLDRDGSLPGTDMPHYLEELRDRDLTPVENWALDHDLYPLTAMTTTKLNYSIEEFLEPNALGEAYEVAYRLLFVREMTDILRTDFLSATTETLGKRLEGLEAVTLNQTFTCTVEILMALVFFFDDRTPLLRPGRGKRKATHR